MPATITEIWRYPVKSMGGEQIATTAVAERGVHADRMWAIRDVERDTISTARSLPALLHCAARYPEDPAGHPAEPGNAPEVIVTLPDGEEISSNHPHVHSNLSELVGTEVRLEPLPALSDKDKYRKPPETKASVRATFGIADDEPLPDLSVFPLRKLAELLGRFDLVRVQRSRLPRRAVRAVVASRGGARALLRLPDRPALRRRLAGQPPSLIVVGRHEQRSAVSFGQRAILY